MFKIEEFTEARVASVSNRIEKHGDDDVPAVSLAFEVEAANTLLDVIDPMIRHALYKAKPDSEPELEGIEQSTPVLRCNSFEKHALTTSHEGWTLSVDDNIDENDPMVFGGCKVDKFTVDAKQGGSIVLRFRVGTSDVDADKLGALAMHNGQAVWIKVTPPAKPAEAIDGTKGHPGAEAAGQGSLLTPEDALASAAQNGANAPETRADAGDGVVPGGGPDDEQQDDDSEGSNPDDAAAFEAGATKAVAAAKTGRRGRRVAV